MTVVWIIGGIILVLGVFVGYVILSRDKTDEHQKRWDAGYLNRKTFGHEPDPYDDP